jgi:glycosyltransferase involved in cell wall biosynthesis
VHEGGCLAWSGLRAFVPRGFRGLLSGVAQDADIVHSHEIWQFINNDAAAVAFRRRLPHVISPHGALDDWALHRSAWKKAVARRLYADRNLRRAACLHALTEREAENIRAFGLKGAIAVVPNGVELGAFDDLPDRHLAGTFWPDLRDKSLILFLGRIHPKKGLANLVEAWARLQARFADWHLVVAGPDEIGHLHQIRSLAAERRIEARVTFAGPVYGRRKRALLAAADLFCLPSFSEGFSMAVLEAMACRLPVLLSTQCYFDEVERAGAGRTVEPTADALEARMRTLLNLSAEDLRLMGERGRRLVEEAYSWPRVARRMLAVYRWLLGGGERPEEVALPDG